MDISKLISELAAHRVASFKGYGIEVEFHRSEERSTPRVSPVQVQQETNQVIADLVAAATKQDAAAAADPGMAQSLDAEMSYDQIRDWSGSPDPLTQSVPLTGDIPTLTNEQS